MCHPDPFIMKLRCMINLYPLSVWLSDPPPFPPLSILSNNQWLNYWRIRHWPADDSAMNNGYCIEFTAPHQLSVIMKLLGCNRLSQDCDREIHLYKQLVMSSRWCGHHGVAFRGWYKSAIMVEVGLKLNWLLTSAVQWSGWWTKEQQN